MSVFEKLNAINVNDKTEKRNGFTYLSWSYAWGEVKKLYPESTYKVYENENGWNYFTDGRTCWVKTGVTIEGLEHIEYLPVMDYRNNSISFEKVTSFDVNKAIQRSLTKAIARHGLGLYIYAGEDLPEEDKPINKLKDEKVMQETKKQMKETAPKTKATKWVCADCGTEFDDEFIANGTMKAYGRYLCTDCGFKAKRFRTSQ